MKRQKKVTHTFGLRFEVKHCWASKKKAEFRKVVGEAAASPKQWFPSGR